MNYEGLHKSKGTKAAALAGVVANAFNPSTREAEAGGFLSSRPAWSTKFRPK
jgi:major histocompatibility complex class I